MKITIEGDPKEIAGLRALALREDQLIDSKIVDAVIAKVTEAVKKSATYRTTPFQEHGTETPCPFRD
ncbi:MAG: hypothetical protein IKP64_04245 [Selenomonadaceae bacterium]|nr:hypothetical protein [Selenomonadaceae bacterium]